MKILIIIIIAFLTLVYVYTYMRYKKMKKQGCIDNVAEFQKKYRKTMPKQKHKNYGTEQYTEYITKYNSSIDYVEKDEYLSRQDTRK